MELNNNDIEKNNWISVAQNIHMQMNHFLIYTLILFKDR